MWPQNPIDTPELLTDDSVPLLVAAFACACSACATLCWFVLHAFAGYILQFVWLAVFFSADCLFGCCDFTLTISTAPHHQERLSQVALALLKLKR